ncbi:acyltransferase [Microbacterium sp. K41]|uniref:acyltransferase n=1 Tax=Microbacterium sp. K41 TaxID=2305437 RepID=UPI0023AA7839|nr:acyltransferase [Microbacterium sp. K41]
MTREDAVEDTGLATSATREGTRGRDLYRRALPAIRVLSRLVEALPRGTRRRLIDFRSGSDGKVARLVRFVALRSVAGSCGELVDVHRHCDLLGVEGLRLGSRISIHPKCYLDATGGISIGDDVSIAHHTTILSTTHTWSEEGLAIRDQPLVAAPTRIARDVWIGAGARIMAGVTIGERSIVAAGAVVTRDVAAGSIVAGVPARVIREI